MAEPRAGPPEIVRRQLRDFEFPRICFHDVPDDLLRHPVAPHCSRTTDTPEQFSVANFRCRQPFIEKLFHPIGNLERFERDRLFQPDPR